VYLAEIAVTVQDDSAGGYIASVGYGAQPDKNRQYVFNNTLLYQLIRNIETRMAYQRMPPVISSAEAEISYGNDIFRPEVAAGYDKANGKLDFNFRMPRPAISGVVAFDVYSALLEKGDYDISDSIFPGPGYNVESVQIVWDRSRFAGYTAMGEKLAYGITPNRGNGSFRIWYNVNSRFAPFEELGANSTIGQLHFRWWAFAGIEMNPKDMRAQSLVVRPKRINISNPDSQVLFQLLHNENPVTDKKDLTFELFDHREDASFGTIDNDGVNIGTVNIKGIMYFRFSYYYDWLKRGREYVLKCTYANPKSSGKPHAKLYLRNDVIEP
jgi:hypothetical protein